MIHLIRAAISAVAVLTLVACSPGGDVSPTTSGPTAPGTANSASASASTASAVNVPSIAELTNHLATPADLGPGWSNWEGFAAWPGGVPGAIPDDQRELLPKLPLCPNAGEDALALAEGLQWQAYTQLQQATPDPFATMVVAQQLLLADEPARVAATYATLRDGLTRCLTANLPEGEWEIGFRESLEVPAVGDDRFAERSSSFDPGEARRDTRLVLVQDGPVLMAIQIDEVLIRPDAEATLTADVVNGVIKAMADQLP